jgi:hypothetical protein
MLLIKNRIIYCFIQIINNLLFKYFLFTWNLGYFGPKLMSP